MNELSGKKLLILGATPNEIPLIQRAQKFGIYTIVTDYNLDHRISPAKDVADEYWDISWSNIDKLCELCLAKGVNGVLAGFSEFRVDCMIQLCERLHFPCYANEEQLEITRDKAKFKSECRKYGVPVIREYTSVDEVEKFPVIVKPVDRAGSIGVGIADSKEILQGAYENAMEKSVIKQVIIEEYITDAIEMDVHYAVCDGKIILLCTDDIIPAEANKREKKVVQSAWVYPSKYEKKFLESIDPKMRSMINGMGIENGTIFFSGFVNNRGEFAFFECGFRLWGEQEFKFDYQKGLMNYLDIYILHALLGSTSLIHMNKKGNSNLKGISLNFYVKEGVISKIEGNDRIEKMEDCFLLIIDGYIGQKCSSSNAILSKAALIGFSSELPENLKEDVEKTYECFKVCDEHGEDMIFDRIRAEQVLNWWNEC